MRTLSWGLSALIFLASSAAIAQAPPSPQDVSAELADSEARGLFDAGLAAYRDGRYEDALTHFQRAYELSGRGPLLFNIGSAAERCRQDAVALDAYERYLRMTPDAPNRAVAERRIRFLRSQDDTEPGTESGDVALTPEPGAPGEPDMATGSGGGEPGPAPWVVLSTGAVVAAVGGVLLGVGLADRATVEEAPDGARWADSADAYDRGPALLTTGLIALPVGAALIGVGIVWAVVGSEQEDVEVAIGPGGVSVRGSF